MIQLIAQTEIVIHYDQSLFGLLNAAGPLSMIVFAIDITLAIFGMVMIFRPVTVLTRKLFCITSLIPSALSGFATAQMGHRVMSVLCSTNVGESKFLAAWSEATFSLQIGLGGTAFALTIGAIAFLRKPRPVIAAAESS